MKINQLWALAQLEKCELAGKISILNLITHSIISNMKWMISCRFDGGNAVEVGGRGAISSTQFVIDTLLWKHCQTLFPVKSISDKMNKQPWAWTSKANVFWIRNASPFHCLITTRANLYPPTAPGMQSFHLNPVYLFLYHLFKMIYLIYQPFF